MKEFADVFHRGVFQKVVPGLVVVFRQNLLDRLLHICEVHDHSILEGSLNDTFDLVGVSVGRSAFRVSRQRVGAVDMVDNSDFHGPVRRIAQPAGGEFGPSRKLKWPGGTSLGRQATSSISRVTWNTVIDFYPSARAEPFRRYHREQSSLPILRLRDRS